MVLAIVGSRTFNDYERMQNVLSHIDGISKIISGGARGADTLAHMYANETGYKFEEYPADWETHGKQAGFVRNDKMVEDCDMAIAFWDRKSHGTANFIDTMHEFDKPVAVVYF